MLGQNPEPWALFLERRMEALPESSHTRVTWRARSCSIRANTAYLDSLRSRHEQWQWSHGFAGICMSSLQIIWPDIWLCLCRSRGVFVYPFCSCFPLLSAFVLFCTFIRKEEEGEEMQLLCLDCSCPSPTVLHHQQHHMKLCTIWPSGIVVSKVCVVSLVQYLPNSLSIYVKVGFC